MDRKAVVAGLLPALMLYACDRAVEPAEAEEGTAVLGAASYASPPLRVADGRRQAS